MYCVNTMARKLSFIEAVVKHQSVLINTCQGFIQEFRFGGGAQHLRGSGGMFPQEFFLKTNALRLILGHFLVHMHIVANTLHSSKRLCILA